MLPDINFYAHCQNFRRTVNSIDERTAFTRICQKPKRVWDAMETLSSEFGDAAWENDE